MGFWICPSSAVAGYCYGGWILDLVVFGFWISTKGGLVIGILDLPVLRSSRLLLRRMDFGFGSIWILDLVIVLELVAPRGLEPLSSD